MSSLQRQQMSLSSFEPGSKKKFGKNLNKLQKPAPPITNSGTNKSRSSNNGLLLLSTKRPPSSAGTIISSGLLASKVTAATSTNKASGTRSDFFASTHDALMDAVSGMSRKDKEQQPDAWRVSDTPDEGNNAPTFVSNVTVISNPDLAISEGNSHYNGNIDSNGIDDKQPRYTDRQRYDGSDAESWRRQQPIFEPTESNGGDATQFHMSTLARERAERIRSEEETRMKEQHERASQRLRELEEKMALPGIVAVSQAPGLVRNPKLEEKSETVNHNRSAPPVDPNSFERHTNVNLRTLFDPNRTYSSLVGKAEPNTPLDDTKQNHVALPYSSPTIVQSAVSNDAPPESSVIHLASYDDRDRGESRGKAATPRMLFDPRSGSMVAVANDKAKKTKPLPKARSIRETPNKSDPSDNSKLVKKNVKGRKEDVADARKGQRTVNSIDSPSSEIKNAKARGSKVRQGVQRLPRTCGVLYVRDPKGNVYCSDGTDPVQYGSHLVRGGKIRNPEGHAAFLKEGKHLEEPNELDKEYAARSVYESYNTSKDYGLNGSTFQFVDPLPEKVELVKGDDKIELLTGAPESPTLKATAMEWAPSQSAMAAAAAAKEITSKEKLHSHTSIESAASSSIGFLSDNESEDADHTHFVGLGFDPTENMDSVIASPSAYPSTAKDFDAGFPSLSMEAVNPSAPSATQNYFAFGLSGTWGSGGGAPLTGSTGNWGALLGAASDKSNEVAPSFLSLSSNNTWGAGFGGLSGGSSTGD